MIGDVCVCDYVCVCFPPIQPFCWRSAGFIHVETNAIPLHLFDASCSHASGHHVGRFFHVKSGSS